MGPGRDRGSARHLISDNGGLPPTAHDLLAPHSEDMAGSSGMTNSASGLINVLTPGAPMPPHSNIPIRPWRRRSCQRMNEKSSVSFAIYWRSPNSCSTDFETFLNMGTNNGKPILGELSISTPSCGNSNSSTGPSSILATASSDGKLAKSLQRSASCITTTSKPSSSFSTSSVIRNLKL